MPYFNDSLAKPPLKFGDGWVITWDAYIAVLVVNYGISNTIVLEIP